MQATKTQPATILAPLTFLLHVVLHVPNPINCFQSGKHKAARLDTKRATECNPGPLQPRW